MNIKQHAAIIVTLALLIGISGCLTPEERAQVYGKNKEDIAVSSQEDIEANNGRQIDPLAPKAAPTIKITIKEFAPINGLRRAEDRFANAASPGPETDCGVSGLSHLKGQALVSLNAMRFRQQIRIIMPGQMITEDYKPQRLNFDISEQGVISRLWCG